MGFLRHLSPRRALADFRSVWSNDTRHRWLFLAAACLPPAIMTVTFIMDAQEKSKPPPPTVFYFESWSADRSMDEIMADRKERATIQALKDQKEREAYKAMGRIFGMDVETIEREAQAEQAAKAAAQKAEGKADGAATGSAGTDSAAAPAGPATRTP